MRLENIGMVNGIDDVPEGYEGRRRRPSKPGTPKNAQVEVRRLVAERVSRPGQPHSNIKVTAVSREDDF